MRSDLRTPMQPLAVLLATTSVAQQPVPDAALAEVAARYAAKVAASAVFVSGRTLDSVLAEELAPDRPLESLIRPFLRFDVDVDARRVTCRLGSAEAMAVATGNLGCTLVLPGTTAETLQKRRAPDLADLRPEPSTVDWPLGDRVPPPADETIDRAALDAAIDAAFAEPATGKRVRTRAVLVVHRGKLVGERYAAGYDATMPLPGWSMTKTFVDAMVGVRVLAGKLDLAAPLDVPEWRHTAADRRQDVHLEHLLTMTAGQRWVEDYDDPASDAVRMLFRSADHAAAYAAQPQTAEPGREFVYASGSTNLICRILRGTFASDLEYWAFPRTALFGPLGMRSARIETDASGTFVGSSYGFATARDWARFGMLYAQDGVFGGVRILPTGWVARTATASPASGGRYGRQVWRNADPDGDGPGERGWPDLPADVLHLDGHEGQYCVVFPTQQIVVVRLGCTKNGGFDLHGLLRRVAAACKD